MQKLLECSIFAEIFNCNAFSHVGLVVDLIWACVRDSKKSGLIASRKSCLVFVLIYSSLLFQMVCAEYLRENHQCQNRKIE